MPLMKRTAFALFAASAAVLALPVGSGATLAEVGVLPATTPPTAPSCPTTPCLAVSRTTGFQVKVGAAHNFFAVPRSGTIVAWTITLGKPSASQIKFFDTNEGGAPEAGIAVLRLAPKPNLTYKLVAQSPPVMLAPYFGQTAQFPLETTIPVKKHDVVALAVPRGRRRSRSASAGKPPGAPAAPVASARARARSARRPRSAARCSTTACTRPRGSPTAPR
jgi:hypothetical protein